VTKPFGMKELVAHSNRAAPPATEKGEQPVFHSSDLTVDLVHRIVRPGGVPVDLTPREYEVLRVLVQHAGQVLTHRFLIRQVCGGAVDLQHLRVVIRQLRPSVPSSHERPAPAQPERLLGGLRRSSEAPEVVKLAVGEPKLHAGRGLAMLWQKGDP
jgi:two-component system, OmpR family, KDP operon response regulator KdpE